MDNSSFEMLKAQYEHPQPKKGPNKTVRNVLLSIVGILIMAGIVAGALLLLNRENDNASIKEATGGPAPASVIEKISANDVIANQKNYATFQIDPAQTQPSITTTIGYKDGKYGFLTNTVPESGLQFTLAEGASSNKTAMTAAMKDVLVKNGFTETKQDTSALGMLKSITYVNGATVCQINDYGGVLLEQGIVCSTAQKINAGYATVDALLKKSQDATAATSAKIVVQSAIADGNKKLLTYVVQSEENATTSTNYYFATNDTDYSFIGARRTPNVDDESSFEIPVTLQQNINDPKWGTFLKENIR